MQEDRLAPGNNPNVKDLTPLVSRVILPLLALGVAIGMSAWLAGVSLNASARSMLGIAQANMAGDVEFHVDAQGRQFHMSAISAFSN